MGTQGSESKVTKMLRALQHTAWEQRLRVQGQRRESFGGD